MHDATRILGQIESGDPSASEQLLPLVYDELRKLAAARMANEDPGQTLQATALVHEAYVRLVDVEKSQKWESRGHFFAAAAEAMRRILVDLARKKAGPKAGGHHQRIDLSDWQIDLVTNPRLDILGLNDALDQLEAEEPRAAKIIKLRFFAGLSIQEAADMLEISLSTAKADWSYAKNWLRAELQESK